MGSGPARGSHRRGLLRPARRRALRPRRRDHLRGLPRAPRDQPGVHAGRSRAGDPARRLPVRRRPGRDLPGRRSRRRDDAGRADRDRLRPALARPRRRHDGMGATRWPRSSRRPTGPRDERPARVDRAAAARGRAGRDHGRGRSAPRDHRDRRPHHEGGRAGAAVPQRQGLDDAGADQPVRHRAPHVPGPRRGVARGGARAGRRRVRAAAAAQGAVRRARRRGHRPAHPEGLEAEDRRLGRLPGGGDGRARPRPAADHAVLARRRRPVHHAARP